MGTIQPGVRAFGDIRRVPPIREDFRIDSIDLTGVRNVLAAHGLLVAQQMDAISSALRKSFAVEDCQKHNYFIENSDRLYYYYRCWYCREEARIAKHVMKTIVTKHPNYGRTIFAKINMKDV